MKQRQRFLALMLVMVSLLNTCIPALASDHHAWNRLDGTHSEPQLHTVTLSAEVITGELTALTRQNTQMTNYRIAFDTIWRNKQGCKKAARVVDTLVLSRKGPVEKVGKAMLKW